MVNINGSPEQGLEPWTLRLKVWRSTDWAIRALILLIFIHLTLRAEARSDEGALSDGTFPQRTRFSFQMIQSTKSELGIPSKKTLYKTSWRKGSASDSRSEGCVFKSRRGQGFYVCDLCLLYTAKSMNQHKNQCGFTETTKPMLLKITIVSHWRNPEENHSRKCDFFFCWCG